MCVWERIFLHIRTGKTLQGIEAEAGIFDEDGALDLDDSTNQTSFMISHHSF